MGGDETDDKAASAVIRKVGSSAGAQVDVVDICYGLKEMSMLILTHSENPFW